MYKQASYVVGYLEVFSVTVGCDFWLQHVAVWTGTTGANVRLSHEDLELVLPWILAASLGFASRLYVCTVVAGFVFFNHLFQRQNLATKVNYANQTNSHIFCISPPPFMVMLVDGGGEHCLYNAQELDFLTTEIFYLANHLSETSARFSCTLSSLSL